MANSSAVIGTTASQCRTAAKTARGSGLGLSIVRAVARGHAGHATASPVEGGGLRITVTLPAAPAG